MNYPKLTPEKLAYTVAEASYAIGMGRTKIYELMKTGELATVKVAGRRLIPRNSALRLLDTDVEAA